MKRWITIILIVVFTLSTAIYSFGNNKIIQLQDVDNHWIKDYKEILYLFQHLGIVNGYPDNTFKPQNQISREEFIKVLIEALEEDKHQVFHEASFHDVSDTAWSHKYIETAVAKGIIIPEDYGYILGPQAPITRLEIAMMVVRALGFDITNELKGEEPLFLDDEEIPTWAKPYIQLAASKGIILGYSVEGGFKFKPHNTATRAETIIMVYRFLHNKRELKQIGYYAIDSFRQVQALNMRELFDEVVFGWSSLKQQGDGTIIFSLEDHTSDYRRPRGYDEALRLIDNANIDRKLMLTEDRRNLIYPLLEKQADQERAITDIIEALRTHGFSGIVMDLETIRDTEKGYKSLYVNFLELLKRNLDNHGYTLTVTVHPNNVEGYYDGYDYKAIGEIADEINIMTHDYHDRYSQIALTDHAPIYKVQEVLENIINEGVPREKIVLGLQIAAGTQWVENINNGKVERNFFTPAMTTIYNAINTIEGEQVFDYYTMTPKFTYETINNGLRQRRIIKYENHKSLETKILLAKYYNIKGFSLWRIGEIQEDMLEVLQ